MDGIIGLTYRCNSQCEMCYTWQFPTRKDHEIQLEDIEKLPKMYFVNITGGEPFLREDIDDIVSLVKRKCRRLVISTNGLLTDKIIKLAEKHKNIGIRVSLEGFSETNEALRGIKGGFDKSFRTLIRLKDMEIKDIGLGITVSDKNAKDLLDLFKLAKAMNVEFAIAVVHNSYYFHKMDNEIKDKDVVAGEFKKLIHEYLKTKKSKNWFRAYMATGIINHIYGWPRPLRCDMGTGSFFLDPLGEIRPCNVMEESMGNIKEHSFEEIWTGEKARKIRERIINCQRNCWMIGSVSHLMRKKIWIPLWWILKNKWSY
jgi:MoaA/NifB/PqqE/SkfB family radical SAM enzyme